VPYQNIMKICRDIRYFAFIAGISNTGDKLISGVNDTADKLSPVSLLPAINY
jgi:hypothetical protein